MKRRSISELPTNFDLRLRTHNQALYAKLIPAELTDAQPQLPVTRTQYKIKKKRLAQWRWSVPEHYRMG